MDPSPARYQEILDFSGNCLGDEGLKHLARHLPPRSEARRGFHGDNGNISWEYIIIYIYSDSIYYIYIHYLHMMLHIKTKLCIMHI